MPEVRKGENKNTFISRCIPKELTDNPGMKQNQAIAICYSKFRVRNKIINKLKK